MAKLRYSLILKRDQEGELGIGGYDYTTQEKGALKFPGEQAFEALDLKESVKDYVQRRIRKAITKEGFVPKRIKLTIDFKLG